MENLAEGKYCDSPYDKEIRDILDPIYSRMYTIQIEHAEWLRENHMHLVMTGPGDDAYKAIIALIKKVQEDLLRKNK